MLAGRISVLVLWFAAAGAACAQGSSQPPRTADGRPDFGGVWVSRWITPLERQAPLKNLVMTPEEVGQALKAEWERHDRIDGIESIDGFEYTGFVIVHGETRSSIIVDPPDGRLPYKDPATRVGARPPTGLEGPESRALNERCLVSGNGFAPMLTAPASNIREIVQTRSDIVIWTELMSQLRIIPIDGRPGTGARREQMAGQWDGDTLVVETTGIPDPSRGARGSLFAVTPETRITERLTRTGPDEILYRFTVEDASLYTRAWSGETVMRRSSDRMFEFACHEGNYGLANILSGARVLEARTEMAATAKAAKTGPVKAKGRRKEKP